jgi:hypothetical protein
MSSRLNFDRTRAGRSISQPAIQSTSWIGVTNKQQLINRDSQQQLSHSNRNRTPTTHPIGSQ